MGTKQASPMESEAMVRACLNTLVPETRARRLKWTRGSVGNQWFATRNGVTVTVSNVNNHKVAIRFCRGGGEDLQSGYDLTDDDFALGRSVSFDSPQARERPYGLLWNVIGSLEGVAAQIGRDFRPLADDWAAIESGIIGF